MSECEVCGYASGAPFLAEIEGARMKVCKNCLSLGTEIKQPKLNKTTFSRKTTIVSMQEEVIIENYADVITAARQMKNFTRESLAATIGEKVNIISRVENGKLKPDIKLAKKLEKLLQVQLFEVLGNETIATVSKPNEPLTLGDVAEIKTV